MIGEVGSEICWLPASIENPYNGWQNLTTKPWAPNAPGKTDTHHTD